jgi:hypothetical protein
MRNNRLSHTVGFCIDAHGAVSERSRPGRGTCHETTRRWLKSGVASAVLAWLVATALPASADPQSELAQARHELAISEQVLARATERAEAARADPTIGPEQRQRLDDYVARVGELVASNREHVRSLSQAASTRPAGTGATVTPPAATQAEEVAALEARLGGSLAEFDQLLLDEARRARAPGGNGGLGAGRSGGGAAGASASKGGGTRSKAPGAPDSPETGATPPHTAGDPGSPGGRIEGSSPGSTGPTASRPADVGDGADDDVVARQIRRAAETERDPQLRDKLWDEYRKYKHGTKG